MRRRNAK